MLLYIMCLADAIMRYQTPETMLVSQDNPFKTGLNIKHS